MEKVLYSVAEVAELLKINKNTVYDLLRNQVLKGIRLGSMKVTNEEVMRFLREYTGKDLTDLKNIVDLKY